MNGRARWQLRELLNRTMDAIERAEAIDPKDDTGLAVAVNDVAMHRKYLETGLDMCVGSLKTVEETEQEFWHTNDEAMTALEDMEY